MVERSLKFVDFERAQPDKRAAEIRREDFGEILAAFSGPAAAEQAARCSQCGVPFCQSHCPLSNNIPDWLRLTAEGRLEEAYALSAATNPMPEICGRICPQDRLCEGSCVIEQSGHGAVTIGAVEKHLTETAWAEGWVQPLRAARERGTSVGIVGAGPAGLAAAEFLRARGHQVTVYDRHDRPGGLLIYGIPAFKLDKAVVARRTDRLAAGGVEFVLGCEVGRDLPFEDMRARHDAVLIAVGVYAARNLGLPGEGAKGVLAAMDYLTAANRVGLGDHVAAFRSGALDAKGKAVVVLGGGDTAMDCVRTAIRQGATAVSCLYRRNRANMPGSRAEVGHAEEEGVTFEWLAQPVAMLGDARRTRGVRAVRMRLGPADASGRQAPEASPGSEFDAPADLVIKALGFEAEDLPTLWKAPALRRNRHGGVWIAEQSFETSLPGVFAAGDIVRGASLVVWALREGREAAAQIHRRLAPGAPADRAVEMAAE